MKGFQSIITALSVTMLMSGCVSTKSEIASENNGVIKYQSRCGIHENTNADNLANSIDEFLLSTKPPIYPRKAARNRIQGYTRLEFDVSPEGVPININVIEAYPSDVFNAAAIRSFSGWRYKPQASACHSIQLDFKLA